MTTLAAWLGLKTIVPPNEAQLVAIAKWLMRGRMYADRRAILRRVCHAWRRVFEMEDLGVDPPRYVPLHRKWAHPNPPPPPPLLLDRERRNNGPGDELRQMRAVANDHFDSKVAQFINGCIDDTQASWARSAVLQLYARCVHDFESSLSTRQFTVLQMAGRETMNGETPPVVSAVDLPRGSFASMLWTHCGGAQVRQEAAIPHNWHSMTEPVLYETYDRWHKQEVVWYSRALLPCVAGVQKHLVRYPKIALQMHQIRRLSLSRLLEVIEKEQPSDLYDRDAIYYKTTMRALLQDFGDPDLIPGSVVLYLHMWYVWKKIEYELYLRSKRRGDTVSIVRPDRFENGPQPNAASTWWSWFWMPRMPCISPSAAEDFELPSSGTKRALRGRPPL